MHLPLPRQELGLHPLVPRAGEPVLAALSGASGAGREGGRGAVLVGVLAGFGARGGVLCAVGGGEGGAAEAAEGGGGGLGWGEGEGGEGGYCLVG